MNTDQSNKINQANRENSNLLKSSSSSLKIDLNNITKHCIAKEDKFLKKKTSKLFLNKMKTSTILNKSRRKGILFKQQNTSNEQNLNCVGSFQFLQINLLNLIKEMQKNKNFLEESEGNTNIMISESINKNKSNEFLSKENNINNITDKLEKI